MTLHTAIIANALLELGIVLALAAVIAAPFRLDRGRDEASLYSMAAPLPEELAA